MKKLRNKVFFVLFGILSIFLVGVLIVFNYQNYMNEKERVMSALNRVTTPPEDRSKPINNQNIREFTEEEKDDLSKKIFVDLDVYTVLVNVDDDSLEVINHSGSIADNDDILKYATNVMKEGFSDSLYVGNLYSRKYSYSFKNGFLVIVDNKSVQRRLYSLLKTSIVLFVFVEIFIVILSILLTRWIIRPVIDSFQKQKQFIADASHELKTPLAVIMANADALENDLSEKKWLDNITEEANRMNHLITNLLNLARLEEQGLQNFTEVNLSKKLEKSILTFESLVYEKNLKLDYYIDDDITIMGNVEELKQLFVILMDNAIEHSSKNGMIYVSLRKKKREVYLEFKNSGEGIPKGLEEKIFERFYKIDSSRNRDSNHYGLGLAIAKEIVINHHGVISASSHGGDTVFSIQWKTNK